MINDIRVGVIGLQGGTPDPHHINQVIEFISEELVDGYKLECHWGFVDKNPDYYMFIDADDHSSLNVSVEDLMPAIVWVKDFVDNSKDEGVLLLEQDDDNELGIHQVDLDSEQGYYRFTITDDHDTWIYVMWEV